MQIADQVVVITGASSGIGRATALAFAREGARLVLAGRSMERLRETEQDCIAAGARVTSVECDVASYGDIEGVAQHALQAHGRFDVWINNAGVMSFGRLDETPAEDHERIISTNLCGCIFGAQIAVNHFRGRGRGTLINVASIVGEAAQVYSTSYTASKWGVRGLSQALRAELADERDIHVCTVLPAVIDTPLFEHAANYMGRKVQAASPAYPAERVAETIVELVHSPKSEVVVGGAGRLVTYGHAVLPETTNRLMRSMVEQQMLTDQPERPSSGTLHRPGGSTGISGGRPDAVAAGERLDTIMRAVGFGALSLSIVAAAAAVLWPRPGVATSNLPRTLARNLPGLLSAGLSRAVTRDLPRTIADNLPRAQDVSRAFSRNLPESFTRRWRW